MNDRARGRTPPPRARLVQCLSTEAFALAEAEPSTFRPPGCVLSRLALAFALPEPLAEVSMACAGFCALVESDFVGSRVALACPLPTRAPPALSPRGSLCEESLCSD